MQYQCIKYSKAIHTKVTLLPKELYYTLTAMCYTTAMNAILLMTIYLSITNIIGFALMGIDKRRAVKRAFRIPEATLFIVALIGGSIGSIIGMHLFHHKTRHWYFVYGMPAILIVQIIIVLVLLLAPLEFAFL